MKTNFIFIFITAFTCSINLHAQKSKTKKVYVKHVRLPLNTVFKDYETYSFDVFIPYDLKIDTSHHEKNGEVLPSLMMRNTIRIELKWMVFHE